jgi:hypothetical protein
VTIPAAIAVAPSVTPQKATKVVANWFGLGRPARIKLLQNPPDQVTQYCDSDQDSIAKCQFEKVRYTPQEQAFGDAKQMSALGQKRTYALQKGMSALPPKADKLVLT